MMAPILTDAICIQPDSVSTPTYRHKALTEPKDPLTQKVLLSLKSFFF